MCLLRWLRFWNVGLDDDCYERFGEYGPLGVGSCLNESRDLLHMLCAISRNEDDRLDRRVDGLDRKECGDIGGDSKPVILLVASPAA